MIENFFVRLFILNALLFAVCFLWATVVYWRRRRKWRRTWGRVPPNQWEQLASHLKYGPQLPLDTPQVMASVDKWLNREEPDD